MPNISTGNTLVDMHKNTIYNAIITIAILAAFENISNLLKFSFTKAH